SEERTGTVRVEGAGLVVALTGSEAHTLADDAARKLLAQLKPAGVRGRVRVEFELDGGDGQPVRDSRPGAVRKIARGEPVGVSPERRERRRRSRGRRGRRGAPAADGGDVSAGLQSASADGAGATVPNAADNGAATRPEAPQEHPVDGQIGAQTPS
ncbi:MAG TPA: hypothetical protein VMU66_08980, partial [Gaiellales bacterium]|nr:hypothetical protein [Gaiellales bacterium]